VSRKPSFITYLDKSILFAAVGVVIAAIVSQQGGGVFLLFVYYSAFLVPACPRFIKHWCRSVF